LRLRLREEIIKQEAYKNKERAMGDEQQAAKRQMMELMQAGRSWQEAARIAGVQTSRSTAYRWWQAYRTRGEIALHDGRHGHTSKVCEPVLHWLEFRCSQAPKTPSSVIQKDLQERFGLVVSITHLNRLRASRGLARQAVRGGKNLRPKLLI
jgi:transposase